MNSDSSARFPVAAALRMRRTVHDFVPGSAPAPELVQDAIGHAVLAPNHYRTRPWRFYLPGPETVARICAINADLIRKSRGEGAAATKLKRWQAVPGWMVLTCIRSEDVVRQREDYAACCCAAQNFALFLWERGYGVKWTTGEVTRTVEFHAALGIAHDNEDVVGLFWFGTPASIPDLEPDAAPAPVFSSP